MSHSPGELQSSPVGNSTRDRIVLRRNRVRKPFIERGRQSPSCSSFAVCRGVRTMSLKWSTKSPTRGSGCLIHSTIAPAAQGGRVRVDKRRVQAVQRPLPPRRGWTIAHVRVFHRIFSFRRARAVSTYVKRWRAGVVGLRYRILPGTRHRTQSTRIGAGSQKRAGAPVDAASRGGRRRRNER